MLIPVIYYHSIAPQKNSAWFKNYLTLELNVFEQHLQLLKSLGYSSISLDEYLERKDFEMKEKQKLVVITFDDGYLDNYVFAYPLLKKYGFTGTIFVNTDYIDRKTTKRANLEDYWNSKVSLSEIQTLGFLNPDEMRFLESSGVMRIESHTKTHDKYPVSDQIIGFHYPGRDCLYPIATKFPNEKPFYIGNPEFERLLPFGTPFFEQKSSVVAQKVDINPDFICEVLEIFRKTDLSVEYDFYSMYERIRHIHNAYRTKDETIISVESEEEYRLRLFDELKTSKIILESELGRPVNFLCWPHGDNNETSNRIAEQVGYKATTLGKGKIYDQNLLRIERFGLGNVHNNLLLTYLKTRYKLGEFMGDFPWAGISKSYRALRRIF